MSSDSIWDSIKSSLMLIRDNSEFTFITSLPLENINFNGMIDSTYRNWWLRSGGRKVESSGGWR